MTINNLIKEKLEFLANLPETDYPFISLYLNIHSHNFLEQNEINRIFLKDSFRKAEDKYRNIDDNERLNSLLKDEKKIRDYFDNKLDTRSHGLAFFACDKLGVFEVFQTVIPFENYFINDFMPHLKQLTFQAEENENAVVVMIDAKYARIFEVKLGGTIVTEKDFENILHRFHKEGGWSQNRYQRHIENQRDHHYREIANIVSEMTDQQNYKNVILIGQNHEIKNFKDMLPKRVQDLIINMDHLQMRENINNIIEDIVNDLNKKEKEREFQTVLDVINKSLAGGYPVLGLENTLKAAQEGQISRLVTVKNYARNGWKCGDCYHLTKGSQYPTCPKCNGNTREIDLIEELVRLTIKYNGDIEMVEDESAIELEKFEGVGAYLRGA